MKNQLLQGDALTILPTLEANSFDALITDPPYASGGLTAAARARPPSTKYCRDGGHADFVGDERDQRSHLKWMHLWLSECARVLKDGAPVLLFTDWRQLTLTTDALQIAGFTWRGITVWDKTEGVRPQLGRFRNQAEYIVWGSKGNMPLDRRAPVLPGVIRESVRKADKHHLTGKPTELMRQLVRICEAGGRVLDPFAGSGTTLVAAQLEGFEAVGIEMTDQYVSSPVKQAL
ncbi:site-specific DNA-methyltransferase [Xanthomonas citri pv. citri]|uniref:DNA-methyltransferase n=2 Tax=Xanthomonas citri TaxID=346 RepID=UPI0005836206|nr:site-specific DNA-methyltransferase [Xanthomonas citri]QRD58808.1 site-specific DNA-methyltransferase [Xanthomonas citri pv. citri]QRD63284.1 site-specific DNA-methyltransferase [Xanthomonas citri pv. citri]QRD70837.1 site-specific DNA-methyltransferase [Xanthomonas citri pv. citri]CEE15862.1 Site-specific DNA-methyltransferase [Xanthomonas citri pv. citri]CEE50885.1 Site-specific DNA-methyltransferase [Xanthomonas citri pv. citri]